VTRNGTGGAKAAGSAGRFLGVRVVAAASVAAVLGLGVYWTLRLGYADRLFHIGSSATVERARRLAPGNAAYFAIDSTDQPALRQAVANNPRFSSGWIELGILAEAAGNLADAERFLLEAASVDRTYQPRWSLANFYFRRGQREKFWPWARQAAEMAYYSQTPLFRLYWRVTQDPSVILTRGIPDRPNILAQYLHFLLTENKLAEAEQAGQKLLATSTRESLPVLTLFCDRLIGAGRVTSALHAWNTLCARGLVPYRVLEPEQGRSITNGDFAAAPLGAAFDWRLYPAQGVTATRAASPAGLRLTLSGRQPERCALLEQILPVEPGLAYRLTYSSQASGIPAASGLRWYVGDLATGRELSTAPVGGAGDAWREETLGFVAPADVGGVRLVLEYRRAPGTTRIEGTLWLRQIFTSLEPESPKAAR